MKIAIIGAGAIGSVVAAYLTKEGEDVVLVGREGQVDAINTQGLRVKGVRGEETIPCKALTKLDQEYDLVIFTTKTQDLEEAYQANNEYLENCRVLTTQNGVQADSILGFHFEREKMYSSIVMFGATYAQPGEVVFNFEGNWIIGKPYQPIEPKVHEIANVLQKSFSVVVSPDIVGMKWLKLFVNFNNCLPALIGKSMQETFADMDFCKLSVMLLKEGLDIVQKANIKIISLPNFPSDRIFGLAAMPIDQAAGILHKTLTGLSEEPLYGSILQSILRKRKSEIEFINGEVTHMARQMHIKSPLNDKVVDLVHGVEKEGHFLPPEEVKKEFQQIINREDG